MTERCDIACNKLNFSAEEKLRYDQLRSSLFQSHIRTDELPDGFSFLFSNEDNCLLPLFAEWIALEKKCCPFLRFSLLINHDDYVHLQLTGPEAVKDFLLHELQIIT